MAMGSLDMTTVNLIPDQLKMNQKVDMSIFLLTDWKLVSKGEKEGITMIFTMKRKILSEMMTTYFPTLLLTAITFATTFFKPFFFEAALSVNLTTMLVMTTIFISKMEGLPPTSDTKMIDIWLILCQMVPFVEVVLLTAMEYNREEELEQRTEFIFTKVKQALEDEEISLKSMQEVSKCKVPNLKTIGKLNIFVMRLGQNLM